MRILRVLLFSAVAAASISGAAFSAIALHVHSHRKSERLWRLF